MLINTLRYLREDLVLHRLGFYYFEFFFNLFIDYYIHLFRPPDFKECVIMVREILIFALLTQVEADAHRALVSSANYRISMALSASKPFMDNCAGHYG